MTPLQEALCRAFEWRGGRHDDARYADMTGWWRDPVLLGEIGGALGGLFAIEQPTVVVGPQSRGMLLGALAATALGVGLVEVRKDPTPAGDRDELLRRTSAPDYNDRHKVFGFRRRLLRPGDRALMVDDWVATGATALTVRALVEESGARWLGVAAIVEALEDSSLRRRLPLRALLHERDL